MTIVGIDPGYGKMGLAVIDQTGKLLFSTCYQTPAGTNLSDRLVNLGSNFAKVLRDFKPGRLAIEKLFFVSNQKTALAVAEARGVINYLARGAGLEIAEYTPLEIKQTITGYGRASKEQVAIMVEKTVRLDRQKREDDELDAIAVALTDLFIHKTRLPGLQK